MNGHNPKMASLQLTSSVFFLTSFGASHTRVSAENMGSTRDVLSLTYRLPPTHVYYLRALPPQEEAVS